MSKYQKVFFLMAVALMLLPALALSESLSLAQEESGVRIDWYKRGDGYYLFLPAGLSAEEMTVAFDGEGAVSYTHLAGKIRFPSSGRRREPRVCPTCWR